MPLSWRSLAGLYGRSLEIRSSDDLSRTNAFYREPMRIPTLLPRGWQDDFRVLFGFLRDLPIPVPTLQSINLTDGERTYILCLPLALGHLDTIQEYQPPVHSPTTCYQVSKAGL